ncbi:MAG: hypothetical protein HC890_05195 [Chloroflexaceae bacterium]|nr:hypothetical protein [Chloroflexaceae bacterium]
MAPIFSRVDSGLRELFQGDRVPLVLVGLSHLQPIYQQANRYPHLLAAGVAREPKLMKPEALRDAAWSIVAPYFQQAQMNDAEAYAELSGNSSELTSEQVEAIVRGLIISGCKPCLWRWIAISGASSIRKVTR